MKPRYWNIHFQEVVLIYVCLVEKSVSLANSPYFPLSSIIPFVRLTIIYRIFLQSIVISNVGTFKFKDQCLIPWFYLSLQGMHTMGYRREIKLVEINAWSCEWDSKHNSSITSGQMKVQVQIGVQKNRKKNWNKK